MGVVYLVKVELTTPAVNIEAIAKAFILIEFHFFSP